MTEEEKKRLEEGAASLAKSMGTKKAPIENTKEVLNESSQNLINQAQTAPNYDLYKIAENYGQQMNMSTEEALTTLRTDPEAAALNLKNAGGSFNPKEFISTTVEEEEEEEEVATEESRKAQLASSLVSRGYSENAIEEVYKSKGLKGLSQLQGIDKSVLDIISESMTPNEFGIITIPASQKVYSPTPFEHPDRSVSWQRALFNAVLAGGVAYLGAKAAGFDSQDMRAAFLLAGATQFGNDGNMNHRYKSLDALKNEGYTAESIEAYMDSGDRSVLKKPEQGKWSPLGDGRMWRPEANGDISIMGKKKPEVFETKTTIEGGFKVTTSLSKDGVVLGRTQELYTPPKAERAPRNVVSVKYNEAGNVRTTTYSDGTTMTEDVRTGEKDTRSAAEKTADRSDKVLLQQPDVPFALKEKLSVFKNENGEWDTQDESNMAVDLAWKTGGVGKPPVGMDTVTKFMGQDDRERYIKAVELNASMENMGIAEARSMGASGINTQAEAERFAKGMPRVDFSSYSNMIASMQRIENYVTRWNRENKLLAKERLESRGQLPTSEKSGGSKSASSWLDSQLQ